MREDPLKGITIGHADSDEPRRRGQASAKRGLLDACRACAEIQITVA